MKGREGSEGNNDEGKCELGERFEIVFVFFFKQKTAYEIYQCDWSSDVCSSDLRLARTLSPCTNQATATSLTQTLNRNSITSPSEAT